MTHEQKSTITIYIYIYIYISELGGVVQPGNRFVSCRACMRACPRSGSPSDISAQMMTGTFLFPFAPADISLVSCEITCSFFLG